MNFDKIFNIKGQTKKEIYKWIVSLYRENKLDQVIVACKDKKINGFYVKTGDKIVKVEQTNLISEKDIEELAIKINKKIKAISNENLVFITRNDNKIAAIEADYEKQVEVDKFVGVKNISCTTDFEQIVRKNQKTRLFTEGMIGATAILAGVYFHYADVNLKQNSLPSKGNTEVASAVDAKLGEEIASIEETKADSIYKNNISEKDLNIDKIFSDYDYLNSDQLDFNKNVLQFLKEFNVKYINKDGVELAGGLKVEHAKALYIYFNTGKLTAPELVKNVGVDVNFEQLRDDFKDGMVYAAQVLSNADVDGSCIAYLIEDEGARDVVLHFNDLRLKMLNSTDKKEKEAARKEFMAGIASFTDSTHPYFQYLENPAVIDSIAMYTTALDVAGISFDKNTTEFILGSPTNKTANKNSDYGISSKVDAICQEQVKVIDAFAKLSSDVKNGLTVELNTGDITKFDVEKISDSLRKDIEQFDKYNLVDGANRDAVVKNMYSTFSMEAYVYNRGFDQQVLDNFITEELAKDGLAVDNPKDYVAYLVEKINEAILAGQKGKYKDEKTQELAQQLVEKGDKVVETETKPVDASSLTPEQIAAAQQHATETQGVISQEQLQLLVNAVVAYYEAYGPDAAWTPAMQDALNVLGQDIFNAARDTGIKRYKNAHPELYGPQTGQSGGQTQIDQQYQDAELTDVGTHPQSSEIGSSTPSTPSGTGTGAAEATATATTTTSTGTGTAEATATATAGAGESSVTAESSTGSEVGSVVSVSEEGVLGQTSGGEVVIDSEYADLFDEFFKDGASFDWVPAEGENTEGSFKK